MTRIVADRAGSVKAERQRGRSRRRPMLTTPCQKISYISFIADALRRGRGLARWYRRGCELSLAGSGESPILCGSEASEREHKEQSDDERIRERMLSGMIKVKARGNESIEQMLRRFKKMCEKEGLTKEIKRTSYYEKPSERRRRRVRKSIKRYERTFPIR